MAFCIMIQLQCVASPFQKQSQLPRSTLQDCCVNKKRYDSELPYQRPDLIEVMEIEIDLTTY